MINFPSWTFEEQEDLNIFLKREKKHINKMFLELEKLFKTITVSITNLDGTDEEIMPLLFILKDEENKFMITAQEFNRLFANGIVATKTNFLIKLCFKNSCGDIPNLSSIDEISEISNIEKIKSHLTYLNVINYMVLLNGWGGSPSLVNRENTFEALGPSFDVGQLLSNLYMAPIDGSLGQMIMLSPLYLLFYNGNLNFNGQGVSWWNYLASGDAGLGLNYVLNFEQNSKWTESFLSIGPSALGWKNRLLLGLNFYTSMANNFAFGARAFLKITRDHKVSSLGRYPLDGKYESLRGLHKIEIRRTKGIGGSFQPLLNFTNVSVPSMIAFSVGAEYTKKRVIRTYIGDDDSLEKAFDHEKKLKFDNPFLLKDGDELLETKSGLLTGTFAVGLQAFTTMTDVRVGGSIDIKGEFDLAIRRLPFDQFEVSIELIKIIELALFQNLLSVFSLAEVKSIALARKQIFSFDFKEESARKAYFDLILNGQLPIDGQIEIYTKDHEPEYLLSLFRSQNESLAKGVRLTYLEKVDFSVKRLFAGITSPFVRAFFDISEHIAKKVHNNRLNLHFEGADVDVLWSQSKIVATDGVVALYSETVGGGISKGRGFHGRRLDHLFVTKRQLHTITKNFFGNVENRWLFDSLIIHAELNSTVLIRNEEKRIINKLNRLFNTYIELTNEKYARKARSVILERRLDALDIKRLLDPITKNFIFKASRASGIDSAKIEMFLKKLNGHNPDEQGEIIKLYIAQQGLKGFSVIHQLLGAEPNKLILRVTSGYEAEIDSANEFIMKSRPLDFLRGESKKSKHRIQKFYEKAYMYLEKIEEQLSFLERDKFFIDENSPLSQIYGEKQIEAMINENVRQTKKPLREALCSRRTDIHKLLDLSSQGLSPDERKDIYKIAGKNRYGLLERSELLLSELFKKPILQVFPKKRRDRMLKKVFNIILKLEDEIHRIKDKNIGKDKTSWLIRHENALENLRSTIPLNF